MNVYLGNLTVKQIEQRLGIEFSEAERAELAATHHMGASNIPKGKWHCFDLPFIIACGGHDFAARVRDILTPYASRFNCQIEVGVDNGGDDSNA